MMSETAYVDGYREFQPGTALSCLSQARVLPGDAPHTSSARKYLPYWSSAILVLGLVLLMLVKPEFGAELG
jgi:hypothetical protein